MKSQLHEFFGKFESPDLAYDVYRSYLTQFKNEGLKTPILVDKKTKKITLFEVLQSVKGGKLIGETIINPFPLPRVNILENQNLREILRHHFVLFNDDVVEVSVLNKNSVNLLVQQDNVESIALDFQEFTKEDVFLVLKIKLISPSERRSKEEKRSFFGDYESYFNMITSKDFQLSFLNSLEENLLKKRLEIFNSKSLECFSPSDFGTRDSLVINQILNNLSNHYLSNEKILNQTQPIAKSEYKKMLNWLLMRKD